MFQLDEINNIMINSLSDDALNILDALNNNGFESFAVGGCVRDCLLGLTPKDEDITTNAKPEEVRKVFPEYVQLLEANNENGYYFYHCPKVTQGNRCPDYENRPQICRDFPDNALSILPKTCGYKGWKEEVEPIALMLHSMVEIIEYYKERLG